MTEYFEVDAKKDLKSMDTFLEDWEYYEFLKNLALNNKSIVGYRALSLKMNKSWLRQSNLSVKMKKVIIRNEKILLTKCISLMTENQLNES